MPHLTVRDGSEIYYETTGTGRPIVFVPGIGMSTWHWQRQLPLADRYQMVTVDPRGQGQSTSATALPTLTRAAHDVHDLIEALDLHDVVLVGWSMGAAIAYEYLASFGEDRLAALALVDMSPCNHLVPGWPHAVFGDLDAAGAIAASVAVIDNSAQWLRDLVVACFAEGIGAPPDVIRGWSEQATLSQPPAVLAYWIGLCGADWRYLMPGITVPTLLAHGSRSLAVPTDVGTWLHDTIPNSRLVRFADSGHSPFWEEAGKFNAELDAFVQDLPG